MAPPIQFHYNIGVDNRISAFEYFKPSTRVASSGGGRNNNYSDCIDQQSDQLGEFLKNEKYRKAYNTYKKLEPYMECFEDVDTTALVSGFAHLGVLLSLLENDEYTIAYTKDDTLQVKGKFLKDKRVVIEMFFDPSTELGYEVVMSFFKDREHLGFYSGNIIRLFGQLALQADQESSLVEV